MNELMNDKQLMDNKMAISKREVQKPDGFQNKEDLDHRFQDQMETQVNY